MPLGVLRGDKGASMVEVGDEDSLRRRRGIGGKREGKFIILANPAVDLLPSEKQNLYFPHKVEILFLGL